MKGRNSDCSVLNVTIVESFQFIVNFSKTLRLQLIVESMVPGQININETKNKVTSSPFQPYKKPIPMIDDLNSNSSFSVVRTMFNIFKYCGVGRGLPAKFILSFRG